MDCLIIVIIIIMIVMMMMMMMIVIMIVVMIIMMIILMMDIMIMRVDCWFCEVTGAASSWHASPCLPITLHRHHHHPCRRHCHHHYQCCCCFPQRSPHKNQSSQGFYCTQGQNVKLKTENLVLKSKFSSKVKMEPTTGSLSPPYSNPSNSPQRQV